MKNQLQKIVCIKPFISESFSHNGIEIIDYNFHYIIYFTNRENTITLKDIKRNQEFIISYYISKGFFDNLTLIYLLKEILLKMDITLSLNLFLKENNLYDVYKKNFEELISMLTHFQQNIMIKEIYMDSYFNLNIFDFKLNYISFRNKFLEDKDIQKIEVYDKINKVSMNLEAYLQTEKDEKLFLYFYDKIENKEIEIKHNKFSQILEENLFEMIHIL